MYSSTCQQKRGQTKQMGHFIRTGRLSSQPVKLGYFRMSLIRIALTAAVYHSALPDVQLQCADWLCLPLYHTQVTVVSSNQELCHFTAVINYLCGLWTRQSLQRYEWAFMLLNNHMMKPPNISILLVCTVPIVLKPRQECMFLLDTDIEWHIAIFDTLHFLLAYGFPSRGTQIVSRTLKCHGTIHRHIRWIDMTIGEFSFWGELTI